MSMDSWCLIQQTANDEMIKQQLKEWKGIPKLEDNQELLERNVLPRLRWKSWIFHQDKDSKHTCKSTQERLKRGVEKKKSWSQSHMRCAEICHWGTESCKRFKKLEQTAEEWERIPAEKRNKLVDGCKRHLEAVAASKGCATKYLGGVPLLLPLVSFSLFSLKLQQVENNISCEITLDSPFKKFRWYKFGTIYLWRTTEFIENWTGCAKNENVPKMVTSTVIVHKMACQISAFLFLGIKVTTFSW